MLDLLIRNAMIYDGTGAPAFRGDIAILGGRIAEIAPRLALESARVVEAEGLAAMPGFVDIHRHGDLVPFREDTEGEELRQGITTFVSGNCGFSAVPSSESTFDVLREYVRPIIGTLPGWTRGASFGELLRRAEQETLHSNMGYMVGNGALRIAVKGFEAAPMTPAELDAVCGLLRESLEAGALGLSMGLMYVPENYYSTGELVRVCAEAARFGRPVTVHMRGEGSSLLESVAEVIEIGRRSGASMHISHLKAAGRKNWNSLATRALELIGKAQAEGLDLTFDVYPYDAGSTALYTLLPPALQEGGVPAMLERLRDPAVRRRTAAELEVEQEDWDNLIASTGWASVTIAGGRGPDVGRTVEEIAASRGVSPQECVFDLLLENGGDVPIVLQSICEEDMRRILTAPGAIAISDALYSEGGLPHPRKYGSFARLLHRYGSHMGMEKAVRAATALPAARMGIGDRGLLQKGMAADLLLVNLLTLRDTATFQAPRQYPDGIELAVLGGVTVLRRGRVLDRRGRLLTAGESRSL